MTHRRKAGKVPDGNVVTMNVRRLCNTTGPELIFVYNADSSLLALVGDYVHKIVSPQTYACNLCRVTCGNAGTKRKWKQFIATLPHRVRFLHRDELRQQSPALADLQLPALLVAPGVDVGAGGTSARVALTAERIDSATDLDQLMTLVAAAVASTSAQEPRTS